MKNSSSITRPIAHSASRASRICNDFATTLHVQRPLARRHSEPARREFHLAYDPNPNRDVQLHFSESEQAAFGFPPALGFKHGGFAKVEPMAGKRQFACEIQTVEQADRVTVAMIVATQRPYDPENVEGLNSVGALGLVIEAALITPPLAPEGEYVSGPELAQEVKRFIVGPGGAISVSGPEAQDLREGKAP